MARQRRHERTPGDRCWLYYNQPWRLQQLSGPEVRAVSAATARWPPSRRAALALDEVARVKRSDAILCDAWNLRISERLLARWGWEAAQAEPLASPLHQAVLRRVSAGAAGRTFARGCGCQHADASVTLCRGRSHCRARETALVAVVSRHYDPRPCHVLRRRPAARRGDACTRYAVRAGLATRKASRVTHRTWTFVPDSHAAGDRHASRRLASSLICVLPLALAGCASNPYALQKQTQTLQQQQIALQQQYNESASPRGAIDRDNQELGTLLAQTRQQNKLTEDQLVAVREQLSGLSHAARASARRKAAYRKTGRGADGLHAPPHGRDDHGQQQPGEVTCRR